VKTPKEWVAELSVHLLEGPWCGDDGSIEALFVAAINEARAEETKALDDLWDYIRRAQKACGEDRVTGEPLDQSITQLRARIAELEGVISEWRGLTDDREWLYQNLDEINDDKDSMVQAAVRLLKAAAR
jgi:hypothetical protein